VQRAERERKKNAGRAEGSTSLQPVGCRRSRRARGGGRVDCGLWRVGTDWGEELGELGLLSYHTRCNKWGSRMAGMASG
jgi:hypothetical protein